jgi:uncharacterized protein (TIGR02001 family)
MKKTIVFNMLLSGVLFLIISLYSDSHAQTNTGILETTDIQVSSDMGIYSKYIWRGFKLDDDPVMQSGIYTSIKGFTVSVWGSFDIGTDDELASDEVDYAIDYTYEFEDYLSLSLGHTYYDFPPADLFSKEFYIGLGFDVLLSPSLTWYRDYGDEDLGGGDGTYTVLSLSHSLPLGDSPVTLDLSGHAGYNNKLFIKGEGGDTALGIGLTIPLTEKITFNPNINYSMPFGDLKDSEDGNQEDEFYYGFTLAFDF